MALIYGKQFILDFNLWICQKVLDWDFTIIEKERCATQSLSFNNNENIAFIAWSE